MINISYLGWVGSEFNNAELVSYLESLGMTSTETCYESFSVSSEVALQLVSFCLENGFWFVSEGKEITVAEEKGFYVEF
jgi:hypothetical protein